jgi:hypothetical protein
MKIVDHRNDNDLPGMAITIAKQEAYEVIASISNQLSSGNSVTGRKEWMNTPVGYFSIFVDSEA